MTKSDADPLPDELGFRDLFDLDEIQKIQDAFAKATGVASIITDPDGKPLTKPSNFCRLCATIIRKTDIGLANCIASDARIGRHHPDGPVVRPCLSGGLFDAGASISVGDRHIANWLIGQVKNESLDRDRMLAYADEIGADREDFRKALDEVTEMPVAQFEAIAQGLFLTANLLSKLAHQNATQRMLIRDLKIASGERDVLEEELRHAHKMEAIGQLAGGVAHDFNNLITGIVGSAGLLAERFEHGSEESQLTEEIRRAGHRAGELTHQLLAFARKGRLRTIPVDVHGILDEIVRLLSRSIDRRIDMVVQPNAESSIVRADPTQLQNVLLNLALNARDAMPVGPGTIIFSTKNVEVEEKADYAAVDAVDPGTYVVITVSDTGTGMPPEIQRRIFEPFFTTKEPGEGTGLGLAAVFGCVRSHGGAVQVRSEEGEGSSFKVLLPTIEEMAGEAAEADDEQAIRGSGHILVVDDEELVRNFARRALTELGYAVTTCDDGAEAVAWFEENRGKADLVLLDLIMPNMSGEETFRKLRRLDGNARILLASGFSRTEAANALLDEGALGFLTKPFGLLELSREVSRALKV